MIDSKFIGKQLPTFKATADAGHQTIGLPHGFELTISLNLTDQHRLGDVVIGQHG